MHSQDILLQYDNNCITMDFNTHFLGTILGNTLQWKKHIDTQIIKLNAACYVIRSLQHTMPHYLWFIFSLPLYYVLCHYSMGNSPYCIIIFK
jgi:hypothetical protein